MSQGLEAAHPPGRVADVDRVLGGRPPWTSTIKHLAYRKHAAALLLDSAA